MDSFIIPNNEDFDDNFEVDLSVLDDEYGNDESLDVNPSEIDDLLDSPTIESGNVCNFVSKYRKLKERHDSLKTRYKKLKQKSSDMQSENEFLYKELSERDSQIEKYKHVNRNRPKHNTHIIPPSFGSTNFQPNHNFDGIPSHAIPSHAIPSHAIPSHANQKDFVQHQQVPMGHYPYGTPSRSYSTPVMSPSTPGNNSENLNSNFIRNMWSNMTLPELPLNSRTQPTTRWTQ